MQLSSNFWDDREEASKIINSMNDLKAVIEPVSLLVNKIDDNIIQPEIDISNLK